MTKQMTPLRQRMIEDMTIRNMSPSTQKICVAALANFPTDCLNNTVAQDLEGRCQIARGDHRYQISIESIAARGFVQQGFYSVYRWGTPGPALGARRRRNLIIMRRIQNGPVEPYSLLPDLLVCNYEIEKIVMRRREFIALVGGAAAGPMAARARPSDRMRRIGVLMGVAKDEPEGQARAAALREGLEKLGWIEGRNIRIEYRWADGGIDSVRAYAAEMVKLAPDLIVANGTPFVDALHQATRSIPIVFVLSNDPVGLGHVASLAKPGGNITGFIFMELSLVGKWLEILKQMAPGLTRAALLFNPDTTPYYLPYLRSIEATASSMPLVLKAAPVRDAAALEGLIESIARETGCGLISPAGPFNIIHNRTIARLAEGLRLPAISIYRQFVVDGGLMAYGPESAEMFRRSAEYVDRILKGESPADLPVQAPTKFAFIINLKTAKSLGLTPPPTLLALADEVIE
jgi:putative ABC transport system substrate-binding protein